MFSNDNSLGHTRGAACEHEAVHVLLVQPRQLPQKLALREVAHADARERAHAVVSALDGWVRQGGRCRQGGVPVAQAARERVPNEIVQWSLRGAGGEGGAGWLQGLQHGQEVN